MDKADFCSTLQSFQLEGISAPILNPTDLSWDRFGTPNLSSIITDLNAHGWTEGIRLELDPNGMDTFCQLVHYQIFNMQVLSEGENSKVVKAQLLNTPEIHPMAAKCILTRNHPTRSYLPFPIFRMRSYALARQFLALFQNSILSAVTATWDLKNLCRSLRVCLYFQPISLTPLTNTSVFTDCSCIPSLSRSS